MTNSEIIHYSRTSCRDRDRNPVDTKDLSQPEASKNAEDKQLAQAATPLLADYQLDEELTAFRLLDGRKGNRQ